MKSTVLILIVFYLLACSTSEKKLFIKSVQLSETKRVDWYIHSLVGGFSRSYLQCEDKNGGAKIFFESFYLSDIGYTQDSLTIQIYENNYIIDHDNALTLGITVKIDTTGGIWNQASSRLGRLQRTNINFEHFHFADSYCPKNECY